MRRISSAHFSLSYADHQQIGGSAVIVPKKAVKGAVARHLLKRRVRAALLPFSRPDRVLIISARTGSEKLSFAELEAELSELIRPIMGTTT